MTECDEVAISMLPNAPQFEMMRDCVQYVRQQMPDETDTVTRNVAESLFNMQRNGDKS